MSSLETDRGAANTTTTGPLPPFLVDSATKTSPMVNAVAANNAASEILVTADPSKSSPPPPSPQSATTTTTATATTAAAATATAATATTTTTSTTTSASTENSNPVTANGKRKRSGSSPTPAQVSQSHTNEKSSEGSSDILNSKMKDETSTTTPTATTATTTTTTTTTTTATTTTKDTIEKRRQAMTDIVKDLLVVLKEHDPKPSILNHTIPSVSSSQTPEGPPNKRAKLSSAPSTIADRLTAGTYSTLNPLLSDISAVCRALLNTAATNNSNQPLSNGNGALANGNTAQQDALVTQIVHFEEFAKDVITRERLRRADLFDFAEEFTGDESSAKEAGGKVALTVMGHHGPLFSSLQNPTAVAAPPRTETLSRSSSTSESPKSSTSTAPTSTCASPKSGPLKVYRVIAPLNESNLPPLVSTVKAVPSSDTPKVAPKRGVPTKDTERILTLGEAFPPVRISSLAPPKPNSTPTTLGLKWGGNIGPGGAAVSNPSLERPDPTGEWLSYRNHPPRNSKYRLARGEPIRQGMGLPADFVVAYSSFAPTRDDAGAKVPAGMRNRVWWERKGGQTFRRMFSDDPGVGHLYKEYDAKKEGEDIDMIGAQEEEDQEEVFRKAVESWEPDKDVPIDFRLLEGAQAPAGEANGEGSEVNPDETLKEITNLLQSLRSHQYIRLSTIPSIPAPRINTSSTPTTTTAPALGTPITPSEEEINIYNTIKDRLTHLISTLPPHLVVTIDGSLDAPLSVSTKIPILEGGAPVYKGTLPDDPKPGVQGAAMAALNAAVGMSPMSPVPQQSFSAPVAMMSSNGTPRMNVPVPAPPTPGRISGVPHVTVGQTYHGHHMPQTPGHTQHYTQPQQYHGHQMPQTPVPVSVTTPHHYPSPYAPAPFPQTVPTTPQPPPPRVVSPLHQRPVVQQQFHGHSMPPSAPQQPGYQPQTPGFGVYPGYPQVQSPGVQTPQPRRLNVPPPQGLAAVGVGVGGYPYAGQRHGQVQGDGLRMGVQHTQASMENGTVPGGRYAGRSRR